MQQRRTTKYIVLHCSATRPNQDVGVKEIRDWHVRGNGWSDVGYHYVIRRSGKIEKGRDENQIGSHVAGHNSNTIGVCLVGGIAATGKGWPPENNFTPAQWDALGNLLSDLTRRYPGASILGHRDFPGVNKACPSFDARAWAKANGFRPAPLMRAGVPQAFGGLVGGEVIGGQTEQAGHSLAENAEPISEMLGMAHEQVSQFAYYVSWGGFALKVIGFLIAAYGAYRMGVMAWRWWRGEQDFGAPEQPEETGYGEMNPQAVAAYVNRIQKSKKRRK